MIDIMRQTHHKAVARWRGKNFNKRQSFINNQITQHRDVELKSWRAREFWRLPDREKVADFLKQIEADANNPLVTSHCGSRRKRALCSIEKYIIVSRLKQKALPVDRNAFAAHRNRSRTVRSFCPDVFSLTECAPA
jgi:hypothetical protein